MCARRHRVTSRLHPEDLARLAELVADRVAERLAPTSLVSLVDAKMLAQLLGVSVDFVRDHAVELGGKKLTAAAKAPWRFDVDDARARLAARTSGDRRPVPMVVAAGQRRQRPRAGHEPGRSLAIRGEEP
jgi:hypothetical protein